MAHIVDRVKKMERTVLTYQKIDEIKKNSDGMSSLGIYPSRTKYLESIKGKESIILKFDVLGLEYWEIFSVDENGWVQANSYFYNAEFDRYSEKLPLEITFKQMVISLLLNGLPMLLKEGMKNFFSCQSDDFKIGPNDFVRTDLDDEELNIQTITPANFIVLKETTPVDFDINWIAFQIEFLAMEKKLQEENVPGIRIVNFDEFMAEMEKKFK